MSSSLCDPGSEILAAEQQESTNFTNDDLNYETETLKVNVEQKDTGYTKYWVAHVQTFSTEQLKSALCGGTYGNRAKQHPRSLPLMMESLVSMAVHFLWFGRTRPWQDYDQRRSDL